MFNKNDRNESKIKIEGVLNEIDALTELDEALDQFDESTQPNRLLHSLFNTSEPSTSNVITEKNFPQTPPPRKHNKCSGCQQLKHCLRGDLCQTCHLMKQNLKTKHRECRNCSQTKSTNGICKSCRLKERRRSLHKHKQCSKCKQFRYWLLKESCQQCRQNRS